MVLVTDEGRKRFLRRWDDVKGDMPWVGTQESLDAEDRLDTSRSLPIAKLRREGDVKKGLPERRHEGRHKSLQEEIAFSNGPAVNRRTGE